MQPSSDATTFLFTDIEGSTRLWEQEGERMAAALAQHDALLQAAVDGNRGGIWKSTGDGIYAAFDDPLDALNATLAFLRALADPAATNGIPIRVRCGLHAGVVERRDKDYFGATVNRTGQIMSAGHGGQVLLSHAVVDLLGERLPAGVSLRDLGRVRLKDLATPEHVYQVLHPELRQEFPPLRSLEATPNNLPQQTTSFVGREREVAQAKELLAQARLLTLLGMGGLGKTRLAMQVGADLMDRVSGRRLVRRSRADRRSEALVPGTAAQVLGVREEAGRPLMETLCAHLKPQKLILILDNCEHVVSACTQLAGTVLKETHDVRIIATSRETLRVEGERTYPVHPLALPDRNAGVDALLRSEAVQLFMERARLQKPGFALTERDAPAVAEICARLEGIPLAMELAAARMRSLSVQEINTRLKDRFKLLTGGSRVAMERQQTLRALVAWSYDMLQETEQRLLERLAVFVGGFDLAAAKDVCGTDPIVADEVPDLLSSLVDKSLAIPEQAEAGQRYRQLETIREFARECLARREDAGGDRGAALRPLSRRREGREQRAAGTRPSRMDTAPGSRARQRACRNRTWRSKEERDPVIAVKFERGADGLLDLSRLLDRRTQYHARRAGPARRSAIAGRPCATRSTLPESLADNQSDYAEARKSLAACLELRRELGDPRDVAATLSTLSTVRLHEDDAEQARTQRRRSACHLPGARRQDRRGDRAAPSGRNQRGALRQRRGAQGLRAEPCESRWPIKHRELEGECERKLGELALHAGDLPAARMRFERSLEVFRAAEDKRGEATALWWIGRADIVAGSGDSARSQLGKALVAFQAFEMNGELLGCLEDLAGILQSLGLSVEAIRLYAAAEASRERLRLRRPRRNENQWRAGVAEARGTVDDAAFDAAWEEGSAWELQKAARIAFAHTRNPDRARLTAAEA